MPVLSEARPTLRPVSRGRSRDVSFALDDAKYYLVGVLSGGVAYYRVRSIATGGAVVTADDAVPSSMFQAARFADPEDIDVLRPVQWAAIDQAADDW
jgi:hypothetical protein